MKVIVKRIFLILFVLAIVALLIYALLPAPLKVETARPQRGALQVTIDEEGETRAHDRFVIASPVSGRLQRIELHEGDTVRSGTVVAVIEPLPIDPKERLEVNARVQAAEAAKREAEARADHAREDYEQAKRERARAETLARDGLVSTQTLEQARNAEITCANELEAARERVTAEISNVKMARAGLIAVAAGQNDAGRVVKLTAPVSGRILTIVEKSERVVTPGMPVLILGDPRRMEIVIDVLSTDAVKIKPGMRVWLERWGGERPLQAKVRILEPAAFKKVSALGVEEQRVNVIADFVDSPDALGDGYRVEARILIWEAQDVLQIPANSLFRQTQSWSVFLIENGKAVRREVTIGHRGAFAVEVVAGLGENDEIIIHPSNQLAEGAAIEKR
jgi:HlyD family secretion protein